MSWINVVSLDAGIDQVAGTFNQAGRPLRAAVRRKRAERRSMENCFGMIAVLLTAMGMSGSLAATLEACQRLP